MIRPGQLVRVVRVLSTGEETFAARVTSAERRDDPRPGHKGRLS